MISFAVFGWFMFALALFQIFLERKFHRATAHMSRQYLVAGRSFRRDMDRIMADASKEESQMMVQAYDRCIRVMKMNQEELDQLEDQFDLIDALEKLGDTSRARQLDKW